MAVKYDEVEVLRGGVKYDRPSKGSFALNLLRRHGAWEVRRGFGQLTQFDCRVTHNIAGAAVEWGYQKHLGSHSIQTDFGHEQILSVFKARVYTSEVSGYRAQIANIYVVSVYDLTTRERWEEPLYRHTSEGGLSTTDMELRYGQYQTNREEDRQAWVVASSEDMFSFTEVRDTVFFGSPGTDLYAYSPATFRGNRTRQVYGAHLKKWAPPYSESSMVWRVTPSPGPLPEVYSYRTPSDVPAPQALTTWDSRLVIAGNGREVFFSQKDLPTVFIAEDFILIPSERPITAMVDMGQSIYVFTDTETFMYQPSTRGEDPLASRGMEPVRISDSIGCISQSCITKSEGAAVWLSTHGVHISGGGMDVQTVSDDIAPLFTDFITDPMTSFYASVTAETGAVNAGEPQRNTVITLNTDGASVVYSEALEAALITLPEERVTLCLTDQQWSVWTYESNTNAAGAAPHVGALTKISSPWLVTTDTSLYLVGYDTPQALTDAALYAGDVARPVDDDSTSRSAYILEYGRGGALDRSVDDEDDRTIAGKYSLHLDAGVGADSYIVLGEWLPVEQSYKFNGGALPVNGESAPAAPGRTVLVPVYLVPDERFDGSPATEVITDVEVRFMFDNTHWSPIFTDSLPATTTIDVQLPAERLGSKAGWVTMRCEDAAGAADRTGSQIHMRWTGAGAGHYHAPALNVVPSRKNLLCYIPMRTTNDTDDVSGMGIRKNPLAAWAVIQNATPTAFDAHAMVWSEWRLVSVRKEDSVAQPVDWAYMSDDVGLPEDARVKARGLYVRLLSHDQGTDVTGGWSQGIFNTLMAADLKTWMAQVVDHVGGSTFRSPVSIKTNLYPTPRTMGTIRDRVQNAAGVLSKATFSNAAVYGDRTVHSLENPTCLIGDEQVDEIATSDSVKGSSVSAMLFGFMRNPAERLRIESVKMLYRVVGAARRRRGR